MCTPGKRNTEPKAMLSIEQTAAVFGVSTKTIRRRIADGTLPAFRVGGRIRLDSGAARRALLKPMNPAAGALLVAGHPAC